jgi:hypothetical protein
MRVIEGKEMFRYHDIYDLIDENGGFGGEFWNSFTKGFLINVRTYL